jgi:hypothetical protein
MRTIVTTIRPDETIDVEEDEFLDLQRQNLIKEDKTPGTAKAKKETPNA